MNKFGVKIVAIAALITSAPCAAVPVTDYKGMSQIDRAEISKLEQEAFDLIAKIGIDKAVSQIFKKLGVQVPAETSEQFKKVDSLCGTLSSVERIKSTEFGSRIVKETFIGIQGNCQLKWELTMVKRGLAWSHDRINFLTYDGNDWQ
jgi:hypothetical protein